MRQVASVSSLTASFGDSKALRKARKARPYAAVPRFTRSSWPAILPTRVMKRACREFSKAGPGLPIRRASKSQAACNPTFADFGLLGR